MPQPVNEDYVSPMDTSAETQSWCFLQESEDLACLGPYAGKRLSIFVNMPVVV